MTTSTRHTTGRRLLTAGAAMGFATIGIAGVAAPAHAVDGNTKVYVCKYVGTPGVDERLQTGQNPIEVSYNAIPAARDGSVVVGYQFADKQGRSVVIQIGGTEPVDGSCSPTPPPPITPTTTATTGTSTTTGGTPGTMAPRTGGEGSASGLPLGLVGGGVLVVGAALLAAEGERRRRAAARQ